MRHQRRIQAIILAAAFGASACASGQRARVETTLAQTLISDEQSNQIGDQVHADLKQGGVRYVGDPGPTRTACGRTAASATIPTP